MRSPIQLQVTLATREDIQTISNIIITTQRVSNINDYNAEEMDLLNSRNTPEKIAEKMSDSQFWIARSEAKPLGVACLKGNSLERLYILPEAEHCGIGSQLLKIVELEATQKGLDHVELLSAKSAIPFYQGKGYSLIEEGYRVVHGVRMGYHKMRKDLK